MVSGVGKIGRRLLGWGGWGEGFRVRVRVWTRFGWRREKGRRRWEAASQSKQREGRQTTRERRAERLTGPENP